VEIKIGIGLENLVFGMYQEEIEKVMGKPDKILEEEIDNVIVCYFNDALIKTKFDKDEDLKMESIEVFNPNAYMFNQRIINKNKEEIIDLLKANGYCEIEQEDYGHFETVLCEEILREMLINCPCGR